MITAMATPKMKKRPPTAAGMATRRTVVALTVGVVSVPFTTTVVVILGTSEVLTVVLILLMPGRVTGPTVEQERYRHRSTLGFIH